MSESETHQPDKNLEPGADPGGPFLSALGSVLRDVLLGSLGDGISGPPGWFWCGAQTAVFLLICIFSVWGTDSLSARADAFLVKHGIVFVSFVGAQFAVWMAYKGFRR